MKLLTINLIVSIKEKFLTKINAIRKRQKNEVWQILCQGKGSKRTSSSGEVKKWDKEKGRYVSNKE